MDGLNLQNKFLIHQTIRTNSIKIGLRKQLVKVLTMQCLLQNVLICLFYGVKQIVQSKQLINYLDLTKTLQVLTKLIDLLKN